MLSRIHRLELHNFKSYAGHVSIGPFKDFTCIVGPNGSGKSNLMDALSFVLSSKNTATLRGKSAVDLIHRGAQRKECSVTIFIRRGEEAAKGSETSFTRLVDHKGITSHKINDKVVNEKEFFTALDKFKIGSRVSNFLVFQHEVEAVAQKKSKELTDLLEQVSGSGELKDEYNSLKRALETANQELTVASMEKRGAIAALNQVRLQKKEAEKYEEILKRIAEEKRDEALVELFYVESALVKQRQELNTFAEKLAAQEKNIVSDEDIRKMKRTYAERHRSYLEELKNNRKETDGLRDKHATLERIRASLAHLTRKREAQQHELDAMMKTQSAQSRETQRLQEQLKHQRSLLAAFDARCREEDAAHTTLSGALNPEQLLEYRRLRKEADCETVVLRQQLDRARRQQQSFAEGQKQCALATENATLQREELIAQAQRSAQRVVELRAREAELTAGAQELTERIDRARGDLLIAERRSADRAVELTRLQEQLHELRFIKENDRNSARMASALEALRSLHGARGRLVDLCSIPNDKYRHAVTVALGKNLEAVVVDTTEAAIACVRYLKEQRLPPMTFLPLDSVQGASVNDRMRTFGGTCKPAVDVIRFGVELEPAVRYALGQTLVCDTMEEAQRVAYGRGTGERYKVVTIDGSVLLKNGAVQGGLASIQARARKWDEKRYEDLRAARDRLLADSAKDSDAELARAQCELRDMTARLEFLQNRARAVAAEAEAAAQKSAALEREADAQRNAVDEAQARCAAYDGQMAQCHREVQDAQRAIADVEGRVFADFQRRVRVPNLSELETREARRQRERAEERQQLMLLQHRLEMALEAEQRRVGMRPVEEIQKQCARLEQEVAQCEKDRAAYEGILAEAERKHTESKARVATARAELDALEETIRRQSRQSDQELARLAQARRGVTALQAACDTLRLQRLNIVRRCQMEAIDIPLRPAKEERAAGTKRTRQTDAADINNNSNNNNNTSGFGVDGTTLSESFALLGESQLSQARGSPAAKESLVAVEFGGMPESLRQAAADRQRVAAYKQRSAALLETLQQAVEALAPNIKAATRVVASEDKLDATAAQLEGAREKARKAHADFTRVKELRTQRFMETYEKITAHVDRVYRELTLSTRAHSVSGYAYLTLEDAEEPYLAGTKYHATPPMKRFMPMELLSGGERTMAALALLFAIHAVTPSPFFVLDEVDAALDAGNVEKLANYVRKNCTTTQFIVISLKDQLYHLSDMLIGIMKDKQKETSRTLTMDLRGYPY